MKLRPINFTTRRWNTFTTIHIQGSCPEEPCEEEESNDSNKTAITLTGLSYTASGFSNYANYLTDISLKGYVAKGKKFTEMTTFFGKFDRYSLKKLSNRFGFAGKSFGINGIALTNIQYTMGNIGNPERWSETIMGGISMTGIGSVPSLGYYIPKYGYEAISGKKMFRDEIFGNRSGSESWELLKQHSWLGDIFGRDD